jgi:protein-tyrosine phosphatase
MTRILMVCLGNICRSPLAEGILQAKTDPDAVFVDSAGTAGFHVGNPPDERSIDIARKYGIDITNQQCRKFSKSDFDYFDFIYVMDDSNYNNVIALAENEIQKQKVKLLLTEGTNKIQEVPDPYYGGIQGFDNVFKLIDNACDSIAYKLNKDES